MYDTGLLVHETGIKDIVFYSSIDSTNLKAAALAKKGKRDFLILAEEQRSGRGRLDRSWLSVNGGIYMSLCRDVNAYALEPQLFSVAAAIAVIETVSVHNIEGNYRWPNDILVNGRKISGILCEMIDNAIIIGIGLNTNNNLFPEEISGIATSMSLEAGCTVDNDATLTALLNNLEKKLKEPSSVETFLSGNPMKGKKVNIRTGGSLFNGIVKGFNKDGSIIIENDMEARTFIAGDVELIREEY